MKLCYALCVANVLLALVTASFHDPMCFFNLGAAFFCYVAAER